MNFTQTWDCLILKTKEEKIEHMASMFSFRILSELEKICQQRGISRTELAKLVGTSKSYITQLFRGDKLINIKFVARLELALKVRFGVNICQD